MKRRSHSLAFNLFRYLAALTLGLACCTARAADAVPENAAGAAVVLSSNGATDYQILVADDASPVEKHAADELAAYLKQVTHTAFAVVQKYDEHARVIAVGAGAAKQLCPALNLNNLGHEGIVIHWERGNLVLSGGRGASRGTLYAVETFLEDAVGVCWWAPGVTEVPSTPTLTIAPRDTRYVPVLEYRDPFMKPAFDPQFAVHNKINGPYRALDAAHGGQITYAGFVHTFYELVPPAEHFKTHPEWYSEIDGKRTSDKAQLCLTNKELRDAVLKRVREWAVNNPETYLRDGGPASIISISQNDWLRRCECAECRKVEAEEGSPAGPLLRFVNSIAEEMEHDFPNVAIDTLAYMYTRKAPKITRPRPNVIVRLCSIECSFLQPLESDANAAFRNDVLDWSKICNRLYVWDYVVNFGHYLAPHPNLRVLEPNIRFLLAHGVKGILEQGNNRAVGGEFEALKAWVLAKLLWDPQLKADALVDRFLRGYYGKAAPLLRQYIDLLHDRAESTGYYLTEQDELNAPYLSLELLSKADALLRAAVESVKVDGALRQRAECAALATRYVAAVRWPWLRQEAERTHTPWPFGESRDDMIAEIRRVCAENNITALFEDFSGDPTPHIDAFALRYGGRKVPARPAGFEQTPADDFVDLQDEFAQLWGRPNDANWVADPLASDGKAAWMPGTHANWNFYLPLTDRALSSTFNVEWDAYAMVRVAKKGDKGIAFTCGLYDPVAKRDLAKISVNAADVADAAYHLYKLGRVQPTAATDYFWAAPANNKTIQGVYVDRIFLVRAPH